MGSKAPEIIEVDDRFRNEDAVILKRVQSGWGFYHA